MNFFTRLKTEGVSLRFVHKALFIIAVIASGILLYATYRSSSTYYHLSDATDEYIELQKAAYQLMNASDFLTENAQRFTINGDTQFLDAYFREAFETKRREGAIEIMSRNKNSSRALEELKHAMDDSVKLMDREYYSMKLVIEAKDITEYPEALKTVQLSEHDAILSRNKKMNLAQTMLLDDEYYSQKELIRKDMMDSLDSLEQLTHKQQSETAEELKSELKLVRVLIIIQTIGIMVMIWLTSRLGINPVLRAVDNIQDDSPIPVVGAIEFRYLAKTYNRMYEVYKKSIEHLNYKASHDELTNVYNRAGYDLIVSTLDLKSTYLLLIDADNFKEINDTYGHQTGDKVLMKIADAIRHNFRSDDYICRIGGDEFVVFMVHTDKSQKDLVALKIQQINKELADTSDGIPAVSISAGIIHGSDVSDVNDLLRKGDSALYSSKNNGKHGFTFYSD